MAKKTATSKTKPVSKTATKPGVKVAGARATKVAAKAAVRPAGKAKIQAVTKAKAQPAAKVAVKPMAGAMDKNRAKPAGKAAAARAGVASGLKKKAAATKAVAGSPAGSLVARAAKPVAKKSAKGVGAKASGGQATSGLASAMRAALTRDVSNVPHIVRHAPSYDKPAELDGGAGAAGAGAGKQAAVSQAGPIVKSEGSRPMGRGGKAGGGKVGPRPPRTAATQAAITAIDSRLTKQRAEARGFAIDAARLLADLKCEHVVVMDVCRLSSTTDFIVVASGSSDRQMRSSAQQIAELARAANHGDVRVQADDRATWVLTDCSDVVVHIFEPNTRAHYDIESLWGDSVRVEWKR